MRFLPLLVLACPAVQAHDIISTNLTWSAEVSRIVYKHCAGCHREGGSSPMALLSYDDARPWAKAIRDEVISRRMPPWGAVAGVGDFKDDPSLSQPEIDILVNWVEGGAPEGDPAYLPAAPKPAAPVPEPLPPGRELRAGVPKPLVLSEAVELLGIRPEGLPEGADLEAAAFLPDGTVDRLLWLRHFRSKWARAYIFRLPIRLPGGAVIRVFGPAAAGAIISVR